MQALDPANFEVIGAHRKGGDAAGAAQFGKIFGKAIEHDPANAGAGCGAGHLRQRGRAQRLEKNGVGAIFGSGLNRFQNLVALLDGVVIGLRNFQIETEALGGFPRGRRLFLLVVVIVGGDGEEEFELGHGRGAF